MIASPRLCAVECNMQEMWIRSTRFMKVASEASGTQHERPPRPIAPRHLLYHYQYYISTVWTDLKWKQISNGAGEICCKLQSSCFVPDWKRWYVELLFSMCYRSTCVKIHSKLIDQVMSPLRQWQQQLETITASIIVVLNVCLATQMGEQIIKNNHCVSFEMSNVTDLVIV